MHITDKLIVFYEKINSLVRKILFLINFLSFYRNALLYNV